MSRRLNIYACSGVGDVNTPQRVAQRIADSGWERDETLRKYLGTSNDGGCAEYFLYTFIPQEELGMYNATIYKKREQQLKTFAYVRELFVGYNYGTEADMKAIIRKGIESTFGVPVEQVLMEIRTGKREGVGIATEVIVAIISAVVTIVLAVISGIIEYCKSVKVAQYTAPTYQELEDSMPAATDITGSTKKKGLLYAALAGVAYFLIKKIK